MLHGAVVDCCRRLRIEGRSTLRTDVVLLLLLREKVGAQRRMRRAGGDGKKILHDKANNIHALIRPDYHRAGSSGTFSRREKEQRYEPDTSDLSLRPSLVQERRVVRQRAWPPCGAGACG